jgi:hypothetical protein
MRAQGWLVAAALGASVAWAVVSTSPIGAGGEAASDMIGGAPLIAVLPKDAILAIDEPRFVPASEADAWMAPEEPVLGITDRAVVKAYSLWQLDHHEIVNDWVGKLPVAVTW